MELVYVLFLFLGEKEKNIAIKIRRKRAKYENF